MNDKSTIKTRNINGGENILNQNNNNNDKEVQVD